MFLLFSVADLRGGAGDARPPPPGSKFFQFHAVFGKIRQIRMLAPPWGVGAPSSGKSWIRYWFLVEIVFVTSLLKTLLEMSELNF